MHNGKNNAILITFIAIAAVILIAIGATFAFFSVSINSEENAISFSAAEFSLDFSDDTSMIKNHLIPSIEEYVDIASTRVDENGNFLHPYTDTVTGNLVTEGTACIDDNLNEICSIYTFTVINRLTYTDIPLYITLNASVNTFENLYYKVLDSELNEVIGATHIIDDRELTSLDTISPYVLTGINNTLPSATDSEHPSSVTYSIVLWIMETHTNQNESDGGKMFASTLNVRASGTADNGITGVIAAAGTE